MTDRSLTVGRDEVEVAHEALIRHWPRLRTWLETDRADLLLRDSVREAAEEWNQHDRDESYLTHRGRRLDAAAGYSGIPASNSTRWSRRTSMPVSTSGNGKSAVNA